MGTRICISYWNVNRRASAHAAEQHDLVQVREAKQKSIGPRDVWIWTSTTLRGAKKQPKKHNEQSEDAV
jgi:hypothetical protein